MATITTITVPCDDFALSATVAEVPDARFRCEGVAETGRKTVLPLLWVRTSDFEALDDALRADPTVAEATTLTARDDRRLYRVEWTRPVHLLVDMIVNSEGILLDASLEGDRWTIQLLHATREEAQEMIEFCESHDLPLDVRSIREMDSSPSTRYGLSEEQYQSLRIAHRRGYFSVPRELSLQDLADDLGISHQSASERLRRGMRKLLANTIASDPLVSSEAAKSARGEAESASSRGTS